jgi:hypothetical protein
MELCRARSRAPAQRHTLARFPQRTEAISRVHFPTISPQFPQARPSTIRCHTYWAMRLSTGEFMSSLTSPCGWPARDATDPVSRGRLRGDTKEP